jgi:hypothetical protein
MFVSVPNKSFSSRRGCDMDPVHDDNAIRLAAYFKWEQAGYPCGDGVHFWLEAEQEIRGDAESADLPEAEFSEIDIVEETSLESFPASDAPEWAGQTLRVDRADSPEPPANHKPPTPARSTKKKTTNRRK